MRVKVAQTIFSNISASGTAIANATGLSNVTIPELLPEFAVSFFTVPGLPHGDANSRHFFWNFEGEYLDGMQVVYCSLALFLSGVLCSAAGIGGGGIYVVVLMLVGFLSPHDAVPLSKAVVLFGSLSTLALNLARMSSGKDAKEKVIDWNGVRVVAPAALGGTFLGVLMNMHTEGYFVVLCLAMILIFMTAMVTRTALQQYESEERAIMTGSYETQPQGGGPGGAAQPMNGAMAEKKVVANSFSTRDFMLCVVLEVIVVGMGALRFHMAECRKELLGNGTEGSCMHPISVMFFGGHLDQWLEDPTKDSALSHLASFVPLTASFGLALYFGHNAINDAGWTRKEVASYQAMAVFTGAFAGLVGVGGGLVFSPFFLVMGMDPAASVATSSTCVLFTSSSTTLQYVLTDRVIMSLAMVYGLTTTVASYLGTSLIHVLQDHFKGRKSYVTMIVCAAIALSALLSLIKVYHIMTTPAEVSTH